MKNFIDRCKSTMKIRYDQGITVRPAVLNLLFEAFKKVQRRQTHRGCEDRHLVHTRAKSHAYARNDPNRRRCSEADNETVRMQHGAGPEKSDSRDDLRGDTRWITTRPCRNLCRNGHEQSRPHADQNVRAKAG